MPEEPKRAASTVGFSVQPSKAVYRRADSFADLNSLYSKRDCALVAPKPMKAKRGLSNRSYSSSDAVVVSPNYNSFTSDCRGLFCVDRELHQAHSELLEILDSDSYSDADSASSQHSSPGSSPIEMKSRSYEQLAMAGTPPSRAQNPVASNLPFKNAGVELGLLSPSPPVSDERCSRPARSGQAPASHLPVTIF